MNPNQHIGYEEIEEDFYCKQTVSRNPLRKWFHLNRYRIANSLVKSKYRSGQKIADLGCGSCDWNLDELPVFGIDANQNLMERAKRHRRLYDYKVADAGASGMPDESFEIVTAFEFLEHLADYEIVVAEAHRMLKKGGHFIISVPYDTVMSMWRPLFFMQVILQGYVLRKAYYRARCGHVQHFSPDDIRGVLKKHGFTVEFIFDMRRFTIFACARKDGEITDSSSYEDTTVILPTLNEERNIKNVVGGIIGRYKDCRIIVADDGSRDTTKQAVLNIGYENLVFLDRSKEPVHGLTASVLAAIDLVKTKYFVVMDADGQHPYKKIEEIVNVLRLCGKFVIASRIEIEEEWSLSRRLISSAGSVLGKISLLLRGKNYLNYDILGGYFGCESAFCRESISDKLKRHRFRLKGYKIVFDLLKCLPCGTKVEEVCYRFETRKAEVSKISLGVYLEFIKSCFLP